MRCARMSARGVLACLLAVVHAVGEQSVDKMHDGITGALQDLSDDTVALQLEQVRVGIAVGTLHQADAAAAVAKCADGLRKAYVAADATKHLRPTDAAWPANAALFNPPYTLVEDAPVGATEIVVPELADGSSGLGRLDGHAREIKTRAPDGETRVWAYHMENNVGLELQPSSGFAAIKLTGNVRSEARGDDNVAVYTTEPLTEAVPACRACLTPITGQKVTIATVLVLDKAQANTGGKRVPVFAPVDQRLLVCGDISSLRSDHDEGSVVCPGKPPFVLERLRTSGGKSGALKSNDPLFPLGIWVQHRRSTAQGAFGVAQTCRPFALEDRAAKLKAWPPQSVLWRTLCADGKEATLALSVPDAVRAPAAGEPDAPAIGRMVRKDFGGQLFLGMITARIEPEADEGAEAEDWWHVRYPSDGSEEDLEAEQVLGCLLPDDAWQLTFVDPRVAKAAAGDGVGSISLKDAVSGPLPAGRECHFEQRVVVRTTVAPAAAALAAYDELQALLPAQQHAGGPHLWRGSPSGLWDAPRARDCPLHPRPLSSPPRTFHTPPKSFLVRRRCAPPSSEAAHRRSQSLPCSVHSR